MATTTEIRNRIIGRILSIDDSDYLAALDQMIVSSNIQQSTVQLTEEQKILLAMSDEDIKNGRLIDQETLYHEELKWLTEE